MVQAIDASDRERLLALIKRDAYAKRDVILASGKRSDFYVDCRRVTLTAEGHLLCGKLFWQAVHEHAPQAIAIGGMTMGADPIVSATSLISHGTAQSLDGFYVRKAAKAHGTSKWIEGADHLPEGSRVVIVEDVVTSGGSALQATERAEQAGLVPMLVVALVDRCEGGREAITARLPLVSLFDRNEVTS
ncbi:MAG: orotate phosphoribosyltransferase [Deltaproteobacteria bacterium]|nr:orotate phosphoribosyltransferase [Deltaproteobacteria bacterium]